MNTHQLSPVVCLSGIPNGHAANSVAVVIAASPITKQPGSEAMRIAIVAKEDKIVVWDQCYPNWPDTNEVYNNHGDYFRPEELHLAVASFAKRVGYYAATVESIYKVAEGTTSLAVA